MFQTNRYGLVLSLSIGVVFLACCAGAQVPLVINGITDRGTYTDTATFSVPTTSGHTYAVLLDGKAVPPDIGVAVNQTDYHEVFVSRTNVASLQVSNRLVRFIIRSSQRSKAGEATPPENGLIVWTPYPPISSTAAELAGARMRVNVPLEYPQGLPIPVVVWVENDQGNEQRVNGWVTAAGFETSPVQVRRGVGSGFLPPATSAGLVAYNATLQSVQTNKQINIEEATAWTVRSGILAVSESWPPNSRIHLNANLTVPAGLTLTIGAGTIVKLNPLVNITNTGHVIIGGSEDQPVVFTGTNVVVPENPAGAWGGFVMRGPTALLEANGAIFAGGGGGTGWSFPSPGSSHKSQQPVLYIWSNSVTRLTNCAILNSAGQMGNGYNSDLTLDHTLWQRAITGGEYVGGTITVNHSAIIEFPNDDGVVDANIADADYDGIYFTLGTHILMNSLFGWAKDDAIDSGSGGAGTVYVTNCWVESAQHEAHAWSGSGRIASSYDIVLMNSGQGLECGWSSSDGSPTVFAERMLSTGNSVGARFGDNYDWDYWGTLRVTNSLILNNYRDIWGLNWDNWLYGIYTPTGPFRMDLQGNFVTQPNTNHPNNATWDPARDGWRLAHWMTTPPDAPVGIGFAVRATQFTMQSLLQGVPVRLSSFTTNSVSVGYSFVGSGGELANGTLTFAPGETLKQILPAGFDLAAQNAINVVLKSAVRGELTGVTNVAFNGSVPSPVVRCWVNATQVDVGRVAEGVAVMLSAPSARTVAVQYEFDGSGGTLAAGTVTFAPGQTLGWATAPGVNPYAHDIIRLRLSNPSGAQLGNPNTVYFIKTVTAASPSNTTLIPRGSDWRYRDAASAAPAGWQNLGFNDSTWPSGPAQLGFSYADPENDERTLIADNDQITSYFRHSFDVTDPAAYTNLSLWLLRDDGGVVYLNGTEIFRTPNLPAPPAQISYTNLTLGATVENFVDTAVTNRNALRAGSNVAAVEIHQQAATSSDVSFDFELVGLGAQPPPPPQPVYFSQLDGQYVFAWSDSRFRLEQTDQFDGANTVWTTVAGSSPVFLTPDSQIPQRFFRLRR